MPKRGLEPLRITPYAPETHVSTIPPLRHNQISYFLFNFQPVLCTQWRMLTQGQPSRKTLNGSAFPAAEYHFGITKYYAYSVQFSIYLLYCKKQEIKRSQALA